MATVFDSRVVCIPPILTNTIIVPYGGSIRINGTFMAPTNELPELFLTLDDNDLDNTQIVFSCEAAVPVGNVEESDWLTTLCPYRFAGLFSPLVDAIGSYRYRTFIAVNSFGVRTDGIYVSRGSNAFNTTQLRKGEWTEVDNILNITVCYTGFDTVDKAIVPNLHSGRPQT